MMIKQSSLRPTRIQAFLPTQLDYAEGKEMANYAKSEVLASRDLFEAQDNKPADQNLLGGAVDLTRFDGNGDGKLTTGELDSNGNLFAITEDEGDRLGGPDYHHFSRNDDGSNSYFVYNDPGAREIARGYVKVKEEINGTLFVEHGFVDEKSFREEASNWAPDTQMRVVTPEQHAKRLLDQLQRQGE